MSPTQGVTVCISTCMFLVINLFKSFLIYTSVFCLLQVTPPAKIPNISEKNPGLKLPKKRKHLVSSETLIKQAKAAKMQKALTYGS